jgi:SAM-dependent methyltransferase
MSVELAESHWQLRELPCPLCGSHRRKRVGERGGSAHWRGEGVRVSIARCSDCGCLYPFPAALPRDHSHYSNADGYFAEPPTGAKIDAFANLLRRATELRGGERGAMLDIGAGCGEALVAAGHVGWDSAGIEPSEEFVRLGRERFGVEITQGYLEDVRFEDESFDLILFAGVLEHVYEPLKLIKEARRLLRPGGLVYIDVPNEGSLFNAVSRLALRLSGRDWSVALAPTFPPFHVVGFTPKSLRRALARFGMRPLSFRTYPIAFESTRLPTGVKGAAALIERLAAAMHAGAGIEAWVARVDGQ